MKRLTALVALLLTFAFAASVSAQNGVVSIASVTNLYNADSLTAGNTHQVNIRVNNNTTCKFNITNVFRVFSPDGADFGPVTGDTLINPATPGQAYLGAFRFNLACGINYFSANGLLSDTVAFFGAALSSAGLTAGFNEVAWRVSFNSKLADSGKTICVDSAFAPGSVWLWAATCIPNTGNRRPDWSGQECWTIYAVPDLPPAITNCPPSVMNSHCNTFTYDFNAADPEAEPFTFELVSGPGSINASTGVWTWATADESNVGTSITLVVRAVNALNGPPCSVDVIVTNLAPVITCPANASVSTGGNANLDVNHTDDCGTATYTVSALSGTTGVVSVNASTGVVNYAPSAGDALLAQPVCFEVVVTDGAGAADTCNVCYNVVVGSKYKVQIEKVKDAYQNAFACVDILLKGIDGTEGLGGFDLLIAYDNSAMSLNSASPGTIYDSCGWEYFTYRFGASGNCSGGCPSGLVRVVGLAETNNGANHPACDVPPVFGDSLSLARLCFLVTNDRTLECQFVPVRFYWIDCGDNTLSNEDGSKLYISKDVFDFTAYGDPFVPGTSIDVLNAGFPTFQGAQGTCDVSTPKGFPVRDLDLQNGGVDIVCADSIDAPGDINMNDIGYEIADAVMFTNYFIEGLSAFGSHVQGSIAASDANRDGIPLSVADLVYLIRVVVGDALPFVKLGTVSATYTVENGLVTLSDEMGGAFIVVKGNADVNVLASNMDSKVVFDGTNTRIVIAPQTLAGRSLETFGGAFLNIGNAEIVSAEFATTDGQVVTSKVVPTSFSVDQNYPNPFNPKTNIRFGLPNGGAYTLTFYNVAGQVVNEVAGNTEAGYVTYEWDASALASGVYFYKVVTADGSLNVTKKAVLLK